MAFRLDNVVPWGRSFEEYVKMFNLTKDELTLSILSCGDGPASFNSEMTKRGNKVISCDPIYQFTAQELQTRIKETYNKVMTETYNNKSNFVWDIIKSPEELSRVRMEAMQEFLADFKKGKQEGRYRAESLPSLPFGDKEFDWLCVHTFCFFTQNNCRWSSIGLRLRRCAELPEKFVFSLCWIWN